MQNLIVLVANLVQFMRICVAEGSIIDESCESR